MMVILDLYEDASEHELYLLNVKDNMTPSDIEQSLQDIAGDLDEKDEFWTFEDLVNEFCKRYNAEKMRFEYVDAWV